MKGLKVEKQAWFKRLPPDRQKVVLERAQAMKATYQDHLEQETAFQRAIDHDRE
jgi:hypothetical protein